MSRVRRYVGGGAIATAALGVVVTGFVVAGMATVHAEVNEVNKDTAVSISGAADESSVSGPAPAPTTSEVEIESPHTGAAAGAGELPPPASTPPAPAGQAVALKGPYTVALTVTKIDDGRDDAQPFIESVITYEASVATPDGQEISVTLTGATPQEQTGLTVTGNSVKGTVNAEGKLTFSGRVTAPRDQLIEAEVDLKNSTADGRCESLCSVKHTSEGGPYTLTPKLAQVNGTAVNSDIRLKPGDHLTYELEVRRYNVYTPVQFPVKVNITSTQATFDDGSSTADINHLLTWPDPEDATEEMTIPVPTMTLSKTPQGHVSTTFTPKNGECSKDPSTCTVTTAVDFQAGAVKVEFSVESPRGDRALSGDEVTYSIQVRRASDGKEASDFSLTNDLEGVVDRAIFDENKVQLPEGVTKEYDSDTKKLMLKGSMPEGEQSVTISYPVTVKTGFDTTALFEPGPLMNTVSGAGCPVDGCSTQLQAFWTPLLITSTGPEKAKPGEELTYTITAENLSGDAITMEGIHVVLGVDLEWSKSSVAEVTAGHATSREDGFEWSFSKEHPLKADNTATATYRAKVKQEPLHEQIMNVGTLQSGPESSVHAAIVRVSTLQVKTHIVHNVPTPPQPEEPSDDPGNSTGGPSSGPTGGSSMGGSESTSSRGGTGGSVPSHSDSAKHVKGDGVGGVSALAETGSSVAGWLWIGLAALLGGATLLLVLRGRQRPGVSLARHSR